MYTNSLLIIINFPITAFLLIIWEMIGMIYFRKEISNVFQIDIFIFTFIIYLYYLLYLNILNILFYNFFKESFFYKKFKIFFYEKIKEI